MAAQGNAAPILIKRKKIINGGGHHGGAWKVAYADFVTAMMAFFMLMWLLNATTEKQRKGIADYFNPTIPVNRVSGGGDGAFGGDSTFTENTLAQNGTGATAAHPTESAQARGESGNAEAEGQGGRLVLRLALIPYAADREVDRIVQFLAEIDEGPIAFDRNLKIVERTEVEAVGGSKGLEIARRIGRGTGRA